ncbi:hypothetical protein DV735_g3591, partial [Chaetothyriales sp. CBS 134920]
MADTSTEVVLGPRPFDLSGSDQRGAVMVISILFIVYAFLIVGMRLATKYRTMALDDWLAISAMVLGLPQPIANIVAVKNGFGAPYSSLPPRHYGTIASALRAADVFFLLSLFASKSSIIWLCRRLFAIGHNKNHRLWEGMIAVCGVWSVASILAVNIGCSGLEIIHAGERCSGLVARWAVVGTLDALTEIGIYGISILAVLPLQMNWTRKFQASVCFALRLPLIIFIVLHLKFLADFDTSGSPSVALTKVQIFRQSEIVYSLLSASIPALNQYLRKFNTQEATQFGFNPTRYANSGGSGRRGLPLKSFTKTKSKGTQNASWNASSNDNIISNHNKSTSYKALVNAQNGTTQDAMSNGSREDLSFGRHDSEDYIIRKDVHYEVRHEN